MIDRDLWSNIKSKFTPGIFAESEFMWEKRGLRAVTVYLDRCEITKHFSILQKFDNQINS